MSAKGIVCPQCGKPSRVSTTTTPVVGRIRRYRICINTNCRFHFVTWERVVDSITYNSTKIPTNSNDDT